MVRLKRPERCPSLYYITTDISCALLYYTYGTITTDMNHWLYSINILTFSRLPILRSPLSQGRHHVFNRCGVDTATRRVDWSESDTGQGKSASWNIELGGHLYQMVPCRKATRHRSTNWHLRTSASPTHDAGSSIFSVKHFDPRERLYLILK